MFALIALLGLSYMVVAAFTAMVCEHVANVKIRASVEARDRVEDQLADARIETDYWRSRGEKLMDQALSRAGAITEPLMSEFKNEDVPSVDRVMASLSTMEYSGK